MTRLIGIVEVMGRKLYEVGIDSDSSSWPIVLNHSSVNRRSNTGPIEAYSRLRPLEARELAHALYKAADEVERRGL